MQPPQPTAPASGEPKATPFLSTPPKTPPAAAKATQPHPPSSIQQPNDTNLAAEIHRMASHILGQSADPTLIQDFVGAAGNDLKLLFAVLAEICRENLYYEYPFVLTSELLRRCQERRSKS